MPRAKKIFDPFGLETVKLAADDLDAIMDFADRSGMDAHDLVALGQFRDDEKFGVAIIFSASYGQRKDSPPCRRNVIRGFDHDSGSTVVPNDILRE